MINTFVFYQEMRPGGIHIAYILGRKDSYLLMFSANKLKEQLKFQVRSKPPLHIRIKYTVHTFYPTVGVAKLLKCEVAR